jgi:tRNA-2-methylthio-N6-dimethylallyladenosine synthase
LLGQTVSSYRHEEAAFAELLRAVATVEGIERIRFTSPYPADFGAEVVRAIAEEPRSATRAPAAAVGLRRRPRPHAARLRPRGLPQDRRDLRAAVPGIAYDHRHPGRLLRRDRRRPPGDRWRRCASCASTPRSSFAYSERSGTQAARKIADDVPEAVKGRRLAEVIGLQERLSAEANAALVGRIERVLLHSAAKRSDDQLLGRTGGFKAVIVDRGGLGARSDRRRAHRSCHLGDAVREVVEA